MFAPGSARRSKLCATWMPVHADRTVKGIFFYFSNQIIRISTFRHPVDSGQNNSHKTIIQRTPPGCIDRPGGISLPQLGGTYRAAGQNQPVDGSREQTSRDDRLRNSQKMLQMAYYLTRKNHAHSPLVLDDLPLK